MKKQKMRFTRVLVLMALCCAMLAGDFIFSSGTAQAAAKKTTISATKMTIPVAEQDSKVCWNVNIYEVGNAQKLAVKNAVKGATYQFTSSDTKVVKIGKTGGYLTGLKAGSATITCTQTYKNKKTTIGKCKVTVKNAALSVSEYGNTFAVGKAGYDLTSYYACMDPLFNITYRNPDAEYTLTSSSEDFSIKLVKYDASKAKDVTDSKEYQEVLKDYIGNKYFYGYQFTAAKAGTYTVTVNETYNKKTKSLGSFTVEMKDASISDENVELLLGDYLGVLALLDYASADKNYYFGIKDFDEVNPDNNVLQMVSNESDNYIYANKAGTAEVTVREGSEQGPVIGTVTFVVKEEPCQSITLDSEEATAYVGDYFDLYFSLDPWETTDKVTIESDNPDVLKVEYNQEEESWEYTAVKTGEANITVKCGNQSATCKVTVEEW